MPYEINLEFPNAEVVSAEVEALVPLDFTPMWPLIANRVRRIEADLFASQGATGAHGGWAPNEPRYRARKEKKWAITEVERASGRLFYSLTGETMDTIFEASPSDMAFGTRSPGAFFQQTGFDTRLGKGKSWGRHQVGAIAHVGARRLFDFTGEDVARIAEAARYWMLNKARRTGYAAQGSRAFEHGGYAAAAGMKIIQGGRPLIDAGRPLSEGM